MIALYLLLSLSAPTSLAGPEYTEVDGYSEALDPGDCARPIDESNQADCSGD